MLFVVDVQYCVIYTVKKKSYDITYILQGTVKANWYLTDIASEQQHLDLNVWSCMAGFGGYPQDAGVGPPCSERPGNVTVGTQAAPY